MQVSQKRNLSVSKIKEMAKKGEKDFSNVYCVGGDFQKTDFSGANFENSNMGFSDFKESNLSKCNFSGANFEWSNFEKADLRNSNMTKTNFSWSVFNKAKFGKAILNNTIMSWCMIFETDIQDALQKNVDFSYTAFNPSQVTKEGRLAAQRELANRSGSMPTELALEVGWILKSGDEKIKRETLLTEESHGYIRNVTFGYGSKNSGYSVATEGSYSVSNNSVSYKTKKKKDSGYEGLGNYE